MVYGDGYMSVVLVIFPVMVGCSVGAVVAAELGLGVGVSAVAGISGAVAASVIWEYSPLPLVVGFASGSQPSAGFWGFRGGDGNE